MGVVLTDEEKKQVGEYLARLRVNEGLTQKEAAERAGMGTPISISLIERGVRVPSYKTLIKLAKVYEHASLDEMCKVIGIEKGVEPRTPERDVPRSDGRSESPSDLLDAAVAFIKADSSFQMPPFAPETAREKAMLVALYQQQKPERTLFTDSELRDIVST